MFAKVLGPRGSFSQFALSAFVETLNHVNSPAAFLVLLRMLKVEFERIQREASFLRSIQE